MAEAYVVAGIRGNVHNWLTHGIVGNFVCRTWESCTLAFLVRNSVVPAAYLVFSVSWCFAVHEHSIWVCMNMDENSMNHIHITNDNVLGALLSKELTIDEELNIIGKEYDIPIEESFRKDVSVMCNLSQGVEEKGIGICVIRNEDSARWASELSKIWRLSLFRNMQILLLNFR